MADLAVQQLLYFARQIDQVEHCGATKPRQMYVALRNIPLHSLPVRYEFFGRVDCPVSYNRAKGFLIVVEFSLRNYPAFKGWGVSVQVRRVR